MQALMPPKRGGLRGPRLAPCTGVPSRHRSLAGTAISGDDLGGMSFSLWLFARFRVWLTHERGRTLARASGDFPREARP